MKQLHVKHQLIVDPDNASRPNLNRYTVTKVTNAIRPVIATILTDAELDYYCASDEWTVTVT